MPYTCADSVQLFRIQVKLQVVAYGCNSKAPTVRKEVPSVGSLEDNEPIWFTYGIREQKDALLQTKWKVEAYFWVLLWPLHVSIAYVCVSNLEISDTFVEFLFISELCSPCLSFQFYLLNYFFLIFWHDMFIAIIFDHNYVWYLFEVSF